jgi:glycosyltransferase involved in cell wall biosynthesis
VVSRVALVSMFPEKRGGGAGMVAYELARHLSSRCQVLVLCPGDRTELVERPDGPGLLTVASVGTDDLWYPHLEHQTVKQTFDLLDRFDPEIVHAHDAVSLGSLAQYWALSRHVPFVLTLHVQADHILEFGAAERARFVTRLIGHPLALSYLRVFYEQCRALFAPNESAARSVERLGVGTRVVVVPNGCELTQFRECRFADLGSPEHNLCFVGFLSERKNQLCLVDMLQHLPPQFRLQLVGKPLSPGYERRLREQADRLAPGRVEFTGEVEFARIPSLLERSHVFVSASTREVQSLVIIEALASGTPVVGLANETIDELIDERVGCRLPRDATPAEFADEVRRVCSLPQDEYDSMCCRARARVERLDWDDVATATASAYASVLAGMRTPRAIARTPRRSVWMERRGGLPAATRFYSGLHNGSCSAMWLLHQALAAARRVHLPRRLVRQGAGSIVGSKWHVQH